MGLELKIIIEAALLASHTPLTVEQLSELFEEFERPSHTELAMAIHALVADCQSRGVELVEVASGFRYQITSQAHVYVARLWTERQGKYSRASLETLALIAYRQPITRAEIEAVRGVAVSSHIVRSLEEREWIRVLGHREVPGRPALYGTTRAFLDYFKLKSLDDLPTLAELRNLDALAPEFDWQPEPPTARINTSVLPASPAASSPSETSDRAQLQSQTPPSPRSPETEAEANPTAPDGLVQITNEAL